MPKDSSDQVKSSKVPGVPKSAIIHAKGTLRDDRVAYDDPVSRDSSGQTKQLAGFNPKSDLGTLRIGVPSARDTLL